MEVRRLYDRLDRQQEIIDLAVARYIARQQPDATWQSCIGPDAAEIEAVKRYLDTGGSGGKG